MAIYDEAMQSDAVRDTARDLLFRQILAEYPSGWTSAGNVSCGVKLGSWRYEIKRYVRDASFGRFAEDILRDLTVEHRPAEGWSPVGENDPLICALFDRYWPMED